MYYKDLNLNLEGRVRLEEESGENSVGELNSQGPGLKGSRSKQGRGWWQIKTFLKKINPNFPRLTYMHQNTPVVVGSRITSFSHLTVT